MTLRRREHIHAGEYVPLRLGANRGGNAGFEQQGYAYAVAHEIMPYRSFTMTVQFDCGPALSSARNAKVSRIVRILPEMSRPRRVVNPLAEGLRDDRPTTLGQGHSRLNNFWSAAGDVKLGTLLASIIAAHNHLRRTTTLCVRSTKRSSRSWMPETSLGWAIRISRIIPPRHQLHRRRPSDRFEWPAPRVSFAVHASRTCASILLLSRPSSVTCAGRGSARRTPIRPSAFREFPSFPRPCGLARLHRNSRAIRITGASTQGHARRGICSSLLRALAPSAAVGVRAASSRASASSSRMSGPAVCGGYGGIEVAMQR
jgi:hypothetical protein